MCPALIIWEYFNICSLTASLRLDWKKRKVGTKIRKIPESIWIKTRFWHDQPTGQVEAKDEQSATSGCADFWFIPPFSPIKFLKFKIHFICQGILSKKPLILITTLLCRLFQQSTEGKPSATGGSAIPRQIQLYLERSVMLVLAIYTALEIFDWSPYLTQALCPPRRSWRGSSAGPWWGWPSRWWTPSPPRSTSPTPSSAPRGSHCWRWQPCPPQPLLALQ